MIVPTLIGEQIIKQPNWNQYRANSFWQVLEMPAGSRRWLAYVDQINKVGTKIVNILPGGDTGVKYSVPTYGGTPKNYWIDTDREWSRLKDSYESGQFVNTGGSWQPFFLPAYVYIEYDPRGYIMSIQPNLYGVFCTRIVEPQAGEGGYNVYSKQNDYIYKFFPRLFQDDSHNPQDGIIIKRRMVMTIKNWVVVKGVTTLQQPIKIVNVDKEDKFTKDDATWKDNKYYIRSLETYEVGNKTISYTDINNYSYQTTENTDWEIIALTLPS